MIFRRSARRLVESGDEGMQIDGRARRDDHLVRLRADKRGHQCAEVFGEREPRRIGIQPRLDAERFPFLQHAHQRPLRIAREKTERVAVQIDRARLGVETVAV